MSKSPDAFRTISEVADWLGVQAHVLRFWESKFSQIKPVKRAGGRRYYRPNDMRLLGGIKRLLHDDGLTIKGVQKILREQGVNHVADMSHALGDSADADTNASPSGEGGTMDGNVVSFRDTRAPEPPIPTETAATPPDPMDTQAELESPDPEDVSTPVSAKLNGRNAAPAPPDSEQIQPPPEPTNLDLDDPAPDPEFRTKAPEHTDTVAKASPGPESKSEITSSPPPREPEIAPAEPDDDSSDGSAAATPAALPSFMRRPASEFQPTQEQPTSESPRPRVVEAADPPPESDQPYSPGMLAHLAEIQHLNTAQASQLAPLAQQMRDWLARAGTSKVT